MVAAEANSVVIRRSSFVRRSPVVLAGNRFGSGEFYHARAGGCRPSATTVYPLIVDGTADHRDLAANSIVPAEIVVVTGGVTVTRSLMA